jgi:ribonuclease HI
VDGAFSPDGKAGAGMILRNVEGRVLFAACRQLRPCADALDAELAAMEEGLGFALNWTTEPIIVEIDCAEAIKLISSGSPNLSMANRVSVIRERVKEREI